MTTEEKFFDVVRVYRAHGENCARARLVFHGWTVEQPDVLEGLLAKVRAYVQRTGLSAQQELQHERRAA